MTNDSSGDTDTNEFRIEEAVTDLVEHLFDRITSEDDWFDEKMEELAEQIGVDKFIFQSEVTGEGYDKLVAMIVHAGWLGLIGKLNQHMFEISMGDAMGEFG